ncbi:PQQ-binding-like beta-propeller repeat protein, partial [Streptomyces palmae]
PYGPPGAPAPAPRSGRGGMILAVVLVLLLLGGGGLYAAAQQGIFDDDGSTTDVAESAQAPAFGIGGERTARWATPVPEPARLTATYLVKGGQVAVRVAGTTGSGYDLGTGKQLWEIKDWSGGLQACAVSPTASREVMALLLRQGDQGPCGSLIAVDLRSGKQLWAKQLLDSGDQSGMGMPAVRFQGDALVTATRTGPIVLDARTGGVRWTGAAQPDAEGEARAVESVAVSGNTVVASYEGELGDPSVVLRGFDLRDGHVTSRLTSPRMPAGSGGLVEVAVLNADPLVVALDDSSGARDPLYFSRSGSTWKQLRVDAVQGQSVRDQVREGGLVVDGLFVKPFTTDDPSLDVGFDSVVAAFDLRTGEVKWQHTLRRDSSSVVLLPGSVKGAVRAVASDYDTGLQLYAFPLAGGDPVRGGRLTVDSSAPGAPARFAGVADAAVQGDHLVVLNETGGERALAAFPMAATP